jgi:RNA polymerase sigma-70 factor (ECF subfamily)
VQAKRNKALNDEWECFLLARHGDEAASRKMISRHQPRLLALAMLVTGSSSAAEDVVQETFIRSLQASIKHQTGTVHGFLGTIAYRLALKERMRLLRDRDIETVDLSLSHHEENPLDRMLLSEKDDHVARAIYSLNVEHRDVLILRFYADKTYEEISELLQIPLGTVKSRIFNAVKSCREILRNKGILE